MLVVVEKSSVSDITKCCNKECPLRDTCFRFLAEDSLYQSYADFKQEDCDWYWPVKDQEELKQLNRIWKD